MLSKFETKSNRVKGLAFHPKRPWILASLHNGSVQLWDYKMGTLIERFDEHEGPVRAVAFHPTQPLFVSGGDDYKIKVWNWKTRRCLFTLNGHIDYIRTLSFHHESPWILSASDDQTIRIWNWQSRNCISILTGHNHYVMSAQFHPKDDLVVSASLDQTIRVWDISGLRKKHAAAPGTGPVDYDMRMGGPGGQGELFGNTDAMVKYVLEGHDRGVNWATFHPNLPLIVSSSDDRTIKLWRMNETRAWEVDTCRGHYNNVSSVLFHPRQDLILSNSEDKTIRIWDLNKRTALQTFRREHDRFWIMAAHPELNLFAAGHDTGLIVFKLERERPAHATHQNMLYYVKDKFLRSHDFQTGNDVPLITIRRGATGQVPPPRALSYNPAEHCALITSSQDGGIYELYSLPRGQGTGESVEAKRGTASSAVFVARNRFAVLDKTNQQIYIKDLRNEMVKQFKPPSTVQDIQYAGSKNILLITSTSVILFDTELRTSLGELNVTGVRYVVWAPDMSVVAFISKHTIVIATKELEQLCLIHETIKIKSGTWDDVGVFLYSTLNHIKYALPQGDNGIIRTVEQPVYLTRIKGKNVHCLDRDGKVRAIAIDPTEYRFKLALVRKNYNEVLHLIRTSNLVGQSIIAYLQKKGYPEVALHFVKDAKTRFELAIECGNLAVAVETAQAINREECWQKLAQEALKQGNHQVLEMAYQKVANYERLSFLYLSTGNTDKLRRMLKIAEKRNDTMSRYHNALYLGDIEEQIRLLKDVGQLPLAYLAAKTHGLTDEAASILAAAGLESEPDIPRGGQLLKVPTPLLRQGNWPQLAVSKGFFEQGLLGEGQAAPTTMENQVMRETGGWADEEAEVHETPQEAQRLDSVNAAVDFDGAAGDAWGLDEDLGIPDVIQPAAASPTESSTAGPRIPPPGTNFNDTWARNSGLAADHAAAGAFESAMQLLNRQIGATNFTRLQPLFLAAWQGSRVYMPMNAPLAPVALPLQRASERPLPHRALTLSSLLSKLQEAYAATTGGRFSEALATFKVILQQIILTVVDREDEVAEIGQLVDSCREYILGLQMELNRRGLSPETQSPRMLELAAYFTHCQLQPPHVQLSLQAAMGLAFRLQNFVTAAHFAQKLLEMNPSPGVAQKARALQDRAQQTPTDAVTIEYDKFNPFVVCGASYTPIYRGSPTTTCPYCRASYKPEFAGGLCSVCEISQVGAPGTGLRNA
ncbi:coatomer WD associated region-domain-containing protein [Fimicolochytrium jonesii]|uniref:coatomer WD associated region-domain-containing protein n=1 Tax=Fimicolochytrium jonesii TaxID=1396493 RepID=UPI0022FE8572|nr:coatomer WD associated region-domain-containing protein [Fimicolochytrium jonesii]KAI8815873.1 coatomer WD associated region-domain-containing protein [Fimicolochytrium jonesii]